MKLSLVDDAGRVLATTTYYGSWVEVADGFATDREITFTLTQRGDPTTVVARFDNGTTFSSWLDERGEMAAGSTVILPARHGLIVEPKRLA